MEQCSCNHQLCDGCIAQSMTWHKGVAALRGDHWAENVAARVGVSRAWPDTPKMRTLAYRKLDDLARDQRLASQLVEIVIEHARHRWAELQAQPDEIRRFGVVKKKSR